MNIPIQSNPPIASVFEIFSRAARHEYGISELIGFAETYAVEDPRLGIALYSAWLANAQAPESGYVWFNLGVLYRNTGDGLQAETAFRATLDRMPSLHLARYALAALLELRGAFDEALGHCRVILGPIGHIFTVAQHEGAERNLYVLTLALHGRLLEAVGRLREAEYHYEQSLFLGGHQDTVVERVSALTKRRRDLDPEQSPERVKRRLSCIHFDIVGGCQLRCVGCPSTTLKRKITMIEPEFLRQCLNNIDVDTVALLRLFNFGEPLLHRKLVEVMDVVDKFRVGPVRVDMVEISTNAQNPDMGQLEQILKNGSVDRLVVSCDGDGTKESYETLRPPGKWVKLLSFLDSVANIKEKYNIDVNLMTRNIVDTAEDKERWNSVLLSRGWTPEFRPWFNLPEAPQNKTGRAPKPGVGRCLHVDPSSLFVDADGSVIPCCAHPRAGVYGNLSTATFSQIVAGDERRKFVELLDTKRPEMYACKDCEI